LATKEANPNLKDELLNSLFLSQIKAVGVTLVLAIVGTAILAFIIKLIIGLRVTPEVETAGLDISEHGEEAYIS
jgi:ammonium transporter, Amt family